MTPVPAEETDAKLAHQLFSPRSQRTALFESQSPEILRSGPDRTPAEGVSDRSQKCLEKGGELLPINGDQGSPMYLWPSFSPVEARFHRLSVHCAVRLGEIGQAADADAAL
jgi:hypothetical protein